MKKTLFTMLLLASLASSGFVYAETVYTWYNEDSASAKSEPPDVVYGAYSDDAEVREGDIQVFKDSDSGHNHMCPKEIFPWAEVPMMAGFVRMST